VHVIEGDPEQARTVLNGLLKLHPDHPAALSMMHQLEQ